ncbi:transcription initiation factor tfiid [Anaeramoeba ignava]|uniref:Transcription initiation factor tfiid n=1 Tax=Anaeramoeba ignava TaxID=1746090 RepID=A0A9Q0LDY0_ANAIG|nr:transcription initiation factor tfiid [Anaeramoeba ignava]
MEAKQIANEEQKNQKQQKYTTALDNKLHQALYSQLSTWSWGMDLQISNKITSSKKTTDLPFAKFSNKNQSSKSSFNKFYQEYILPFKGHDPLKDIYSVCVSNTGLFVLSSSQDNSHNVWNSSNRSGLFTLQGAKLSTKCNPKFSQFDDWVVCGSDNGKILFWIIDPRSQSRQDQQINVFEFLKIHKHPVSCVNLNEDNSVLVSGDLSGRINVRTSEFYD